MGWLGTAWDYTLGEKGSGIGGDLGFKPANAKPLQEDKEGYKGISNTATATLGQDYTAPTATAPLWQKAGVDYAGFNQANASLADTAQASAATAGPVYLNQDQANQARVGQDQLVANLQRTAQGQGPSIAQEQLRQATAANINQQLAAAQSAHGAARLAALRNATWNNAATQQTANSQAAALRAQEIASAQNALGNVLSTQRGQDVTTAAQQAGLSQQTALANAQNQQAASLANAQLAQMGSQYNANTLNNMSQFNAGAGNTAALYNAQAGNAAELAYANQANAGNQAYGLANLNSSLQTNALNTQRQNSYINSLLSSQGAQTGIDTMLYSGDSDWNTLKRGLTGQVVNKVGEAVVGPQWGTPLNLADGSVPSGGKSGSGSLASLAPQSAPQSGSAEMW